MSDTEEATVSFVFKKDSSDSEGGGDQLHMYAPKRLGKNHQSDLRKEPEPQTRVTKISKVTVAKQVPALNGHTAAAVAAEFNKNIQNSPPPRYLPRRTSAHTTVNGSWTAVTLADSVKAAFDSSHGSEEDDENVPLYNRLTNQRWHEIGNGEHPICASNDFDLMVEQLTSVLASRLTELLVHRLDEGQNKTKQGEQCGGSVADFLKLEDDESEDYALADEVVDSLREYVACIGRLHNNVGFHSFEHATHVFLSMNKLLSMVTTADDLNMAAKRRLSAQDIATSAYVQSGSRRGSTATDESVGSSQEDSRRRAEHLSFRISEDPAIRFAMVFSALIHDVGE